ncbi:unnamed protein product [Adineta steineri]|nr:unnamed protein product [Adineta steineri]CAF3686379.1 unnamed protein product [Adineta steineri]
MMKMFLVFLTIALLPVATYARCTYGCSCTNDSPCEYYCENYQCQLPTPLYQKCSPYYTHPRQCGTSRFCDFDSSYTCQPKKTNGERCTYDYACISGNCDSGSRTCQTNYSPINTMLPILLPTVVVFMLLFIVTLSIIARRRRMRALAYYRSPYIVLPSGTPYSYQNSYMVGETLPPPYPGVISTPYPKTYQS